LAHLVARFHGMEEVTGSNPVKSTKNHISKKSTIGDNIKKYRNKLGISQDQLSKKADLVLHTIAKIEAGSTPNPTINTVKKSRTHSAFRLMI
jgi:DNA-binding XRE family transcriptional regulator